MRMRGSSDKNALRNLLEGSNGQRLSPRALAYAEAQAGLAVCALGVRRNRAGGRLMHLP